MSPHRQGAGGPKGVPEDGLGGRGHRIAVGVKTFLRPEALDECLGRLCGYEWAAVLVADDTPDDVRGEYEQVYEKYEGKLPLRVLRLPFDVGLASGRNEIVGECEADYLLMLDDDQGINESIQCMVDVLGGDEKIGGVSCFWKEGTTWTCTACDLYEEDRYVVKEVRRRVSMHTAPNGARYAVFDFVPNSTLFRMDCLRDLSWDEEYKIGAEHVDFYLRHKRIGKWKFAVCVDSYIEHWPGLGRGFEYSSFRRGARLAASKSHLRRKFGITGVVEGRKLCGRGSLTAKLRSAGLSSSWAVAIGSTVGYWRLRAREESRWGGAVH